MEEIIIKAIGNIGFPAVLSIYLLVRIENTLKQLGNIIQDNTQALRRLEDKVL